MGAGLLAAHTIDRGKQGGAEGVKPCSPATRGGQRVERNGVGKGEMFWLAGSPLHSLGLGGGESLKCFQKMRKWSLPLEWLVTPPKPRAQRPPPGSGTFKGGAGSPDVQMKGPGPCPVSSGAASRTPALSPEVEKRGVGLGPLNSWGGKLCLSPGSWDRHSFGGGEPKGKRTVT